MKRSHEIIAGLTLATTLLVGASGCESSPTGKQAQSAQQRRAKAALAAKQQRAEGAKLAEEQRHNHEAAKVLGRRIMNFDLHAGYYRKPMINGSDVTGRNGVRHKEVFALGKNGALRVGASGTKTLTGDYRITEIHVDETVEGGGKSFDVSMQLNQDSTWNMTCQDSSIDPAHGVAEKEEDSVLLGYMKHNDKALAEAALGDELELAKNAFDKVTHPRSDDTVSLVGDYCQINFG